MAHAGSISQSLAAWGVLGCHFRQIWGSSSKFTKKYQKPRKFDPTPSLLKTQWLDSKVSRSGAWNRADRIHFLLATGQRCSAGASDSNLLDEKKQELTFVSALTRKAFEDPVHQTYLGPVGLPFLSACRPSCIQGTNSEPPLPRTCNQSSVMMPLAGVFRIALSCKVMESACNTDRQRTKGV